MWWNLWTQYDEEVMSNLDVSIEFTMENGVLVKKRKGLRKNLGKLWEEDLKWA